MKANEAPEKIYLNQDDGLIWHCRSYKDDIEYTRTDAFIKKASEFLDKYIKEVMKYEASTKEYEIVEVRCMPYTSKSEFIEDFKKYMEEQIMEQYISKATVVAEIERNLHICAIMISQHQDENCVELYKQKAEVYKGMRSFLDTLETKKVDLDRETTHYLLYEHRSPLNEIMHKADLKSEMQYHKDIENAFKSGFKLGIKAQKGESYV